MSYAGQYCIGLVGDQNCFNDKEIHEITECFTQEWQNVQNVRVMYKWFSARK